uniref:Uncharacterized protein n=1 Tax=Oryza meridionalis TaxID=40149 RepID=A0A0E0EWV4_9ORYZ
MGGRSAACFLLVVLVLLGTPTSADECRDISTKDLFCLKYLCKSFCLDEARNWGGTAGYVDQYWCKGQRYVLCNSFSMCFFSNSNNFLFFSGAGWGGDGRRSEKKGEVVGLRGIRQGAAGDEEYSGDGGILPPTARGGRRGGEELVGGPSPASLTLFGQRVRPGGGAWGKGVGGGGLAGVDWALVRGSREEEEGRGF